MPPASAFRWLRQRRRGGRRRTMTPVNPRGRACARMKAGTAPRFGPAREGFDHGHTTFDGGPRAGPPPRQSSRRTQAGKVAARGGQGGPRDRSDTATARTVVHARLVRGDGLRRGDRSVGARRDGAVHRGTVADGVGRRVHGLGLASGVRARQAAAAGRKGRQEIAAPRQLRQPPRAGHRRRRTLHRAAAAGPPVRSPGVANSSVRPRLPVVPAGPAVVAQRDDRRSRRHPTGREPGGIQHAPVPRRVLPVELGLHQSGAAGADPRRGRHEPRPRHAEPDRGLGPRARRRAAGRRRSLRGRPQRRGHPGEGGLSQPPDRADPVRADDDHRPARAGADRAGLDHEVLHPRPESAEFAGEVPGRPGPHGVHGLVEEPRPRGSRPRDGGLPDARRDGGAGCGVRDRARSPRPRGRLLPRRDAAGDRGSGNGPRRRPAVRVAQLLRGAGRFHRGGRTDAVHQRKPAFVPRGHDVGAGLPRHQADGRRVPDAALERPRLVARPSAST